jgi:predicted Zn-dependent peptidase
MYRAAGVALYDEPFRSLDDVLALIEAITPESVAEVSAAYFDPDRQTVLALGDGDW